MNWRAGGVRGEGRGSAGTGSNKRDGQEWDLTGKRLRRLEDQGPGIMKRNPKIRDYGREGRQRFLQRAGFTETWKTVARNREVQGAVSVWRTIINPSPQSRGDQPSSVGHLDLWRCVINGRVVFLNASSAQHHLISWNVIRCRAPAVWIYFHWLSVSAWKRTFVQLWWRIKVMYIRAYF